MKSKLDAHYRQSESLQSLESSKTLPLPPSIPSPWNNPGFSSSELNVCASAGTNSSGAGPAHWDASGLNNIETSSGNQVLDGSVSTFVMIKVDESTLFLTQSQSFLFKCMTIWVGNLPEAVTELDIRSFFRNVNVNLSS